MKTTLLVPPIKCQGIKTKLVAEIQKLVAGESFDRWVEPFCGSGVVAFNMQPKKALLCDSNQHIINFYNEIKSHQLNPALAKEFLLENGTHLQEKGADYYYEVRERFNQAPTSLDFLFLNRACFNGVMRFNRQGKFNVPYCKKDQRFSRSYITKIINQISSVAKVIYSRDWIFRVADFRQTLSLLEDTDMVYVDPPYLGRHVDYFNSWSEEDEETMIAKLQKFTGKFIFSTWHSNQFRTNPFLEKSWFSPRFTLHTRQHFYHVGATETLRHPMIEALITNFTPTVDREQQLSLGLLEESATTGDTIEEKLTNYHCSA
jgi:DNA adenine methylase